MIALDYTVIVQVVFFLVLWFFLTRLLFRPFLGLVEERERKTEGVQAETAFLKEEAERLRAQYEERIERARDEGHALRERVLDEGRRVREHLLAQAREEATSHLQALRDEIAAKLEREKEIAAREARDIAREVAEKILGRRIE